MQKNLNIDLRLYKDKAKQKELVLLLAEPSNVVVAQSEELFFEPLFRPALLEYLQHHALSENVQERLFADGAILEFYVQRWALASGLEKKLFEVKYRPYLKLYIKRGCLLDAENEILLFSAIGITHLRRFYMEHYEFHCRDAEAMLLLPEYENDLRFYIKCQRKMFTDLAEILETDNAELYAQYARYA